MLVVATLRSARRTRERSRRGACRALVGALPRRPRPRRHRRGGLPARRLPAAGHGADVAGGRSDAPRSRRGSASRSYRTTSSLPGLDCAVLRFEPRLIREIAVYARGDWSTTAACVRRRASQRRAAAARRRVVDRAVTTSKVQIVRLAALLALVRAARRGLRWLVSDSKQEHPSFAGVRRAHEGGRPGAVPDVDRHQRRRHEDHRRGERDHVVRTAPRAPLQAAPGRPVPAGARGDRAVHVHERERPGRARRSVGSAVDEARHAQADSRSSVATSPTSWRTSRPPPTCPRVSSCSHLRRQGERRDVPVQRAASTRSDWRAARPGLDPDGAGERLPRRNRSRRRSGSTTRGAFAACSSATRRRRGTQADARHDLLGLRHEGRPDPAGRARRSRTSARAAADPWHRRCLTASHLGPPTRAAASTISSRGAMSWRSPIAIAAQPSTLNGRRNAVSRDADVELVAVDRRHVDAEHRRDVEVDLGPVGRATPRTAARARSTSAGSTSCACSSFGADVLAVLVGARGERRAVRLGRLVEEERPRVGRADRGSRASTTRAPSSSSRSTYASAARFCGLRRAADGRRPRQQADRQPASRGSGTRRAARAPTTSSATSATRASPSGRPCRSSGRAGTRRRSGSAPSSASGRRRRSTTRAAGSSSPCRCRGRGRRGRPRAPPRSRRTSRRSCVPGAAGSGRCRTTGSGSSRPRRTRAGSPCRRRRRRPRRAARPRSRCVSGTWSA